MRKLIALSIVVAVLGGGVATSTAQAKDVRSAKAKLINHIDSYIAATHHRQLVMGVEMTPSTGSYKTTKSAKYLKWVHDHWKKINWRVLKSYQAVPNKSAWLCIHGHEGAWNAATGNGYYGGLQMEPGFQSSYGQYLLSAKGMANNWTPLEQMWVAVRAYNSGRGFGPWPNTRRMCGV